MTYPTIFSLYPAIVENLQHLARTNPRLAETFSYGLSEQGQELVGLRVTDKQAYQILCRKPSILITAGLHGNEPSATATVMWYINALLERFSAEPVVQRVLYTRDLYFIPVVSPDTYPAERFINGRDPNRDWPHPGAPTHVSVPVVTALQRLFLHLRPLAVLSHHAWETSRCYIIPHGDQPLKSAHHQDYVRLLEEMSQLSGYPWVRGCEVYRRQRRKVVPFSQSRGRGIVIQGSELDWYYRQGAFSVTVELGPHKQIPTVSEIQQEFSQSYEAFLHFLQHATRVTFN